jgi:hypothetical protein
MADPPQTSSYCPRGKWMNKELLLSSLNVSAKQLALWVKLQAPHIKAEHGGRVSKIGSPFESFTSDVCCQNAMSALRFWMKLMKYSNLLGGLLRK